jgi:hypothetical protein
MRLNHIIVSVVVLFALIIVSLYVTATATLARPDKTIDWLEEQGYTNVQVTGWDYAAAERLLDSSTGFTATTPAGQPCVGAVVIGADGKTRIRFWSENVE